MIPVNEEKLTGQGLRGNFVWCRFELQNCRQPKMGNFPGLTMVPGVGHEHRQDVVCTSDAVHPLVEFLQVGETLPGRCGVRSLSAAERFRDMAFAQLTRRESLRDIEASLCANPSKLYGMGFRSLIKKSALADANEIRGWRI